MAEGRLDSLTWRALSQCVSGERWPYVYVRQAKSVRFGGSRG